MIITTDGFPPSHRKENVIPGWETTVPSKISREIMENLNLPYPKFMDYAVPGNRQCGICPSHLPDDLQNYCRQMTDSPQG